MFFDNWHDLGRILVMAILSYIALIAILRISGKRTLSKFNAFDFVVTIAIGSTLSSSIVSSEVSLSEGVLALALLVALQFAITWLSVRWPAFQRLVKASPELLFYDGEFRDEAMKRIRVTKEEVLAAAREQGFASLQEIEAVTIETNGEIHCVKRSDASDDLVYPAPR